MNRGLLFAGYFKQKRYQDRFHSLPVIIDFSTGLPVGLCFPEGKSKTPI